MGSVVSAGSAGEGIAGSVLTFYSAACACSGLLPSLIGVCHVAIQFPLYEWSKKKLAERSGASSDNLDPAHLVSPPLGGGLPCCACTRHTACLHALVQTLFPACWSEMCGVSFLAYALCAFASVLVVAVACSLMA